MADSFGCRFVLSDNSAQTIGGKKQFTGDVKVDGELTVGGVLNGVVKATVTSRYIFISGAIAQPYSLTNNMGITMSNLPNVIMISVYGYYDDITPCQIVLPTPSASDAGKQILFRRVFGVAVS